MKRHDAPKIRNGTDNIENCKPIEIIVVNM